MRAALQAAKKSAAAVSPSAATLDHLHSIEMSLAQTSRLVQDAYFAHALQRPALSVQPAPHNARELIVDITKQFQLLTTLEIAVHVDGKVPEQIVMDRDRLAQLLANAFTNAAAHGTSSGRRVDLAMHLVKKERIPTIRYEVCMCVWGVAVCWYCKLRLNTRHPTPDTPPRSLTAAEVSLSQVSASSSASRWSLDMSPRRAALPTPLHPAASALPLPE